MNGVLAAPVFPSSMLAFWLFIVSAPVKTGLAVGAAPSVVRIAATVVSSSTVFAAGVTTALSSIQVAPDPETTMSPLSPSVTPPAGSQLAVDPLRT